MSVIFNEAFKFNRKYHVIRDSSPAVQNDRNKLLIIESEKSGIANFASYGVEFFYVGGSEQIIDVSICE